MWHEETWKLCSRGEQVRARQERERANELERDRTNKLEKEKREGKRGDKERANYIIQLIRFHIAEKRIGFKRIYAWNANVTIHLVSITDNNWYESFAIVMSEWKLYQFISIRNAIGKSDWHNANATKALHTSRSIAKNSYRNNKSNDGKKQQ